MNLHLLCIITTYADAKDEKVFFSVHGGLLNK